MLEEAERTKENGKKLFQAKDYSGALQQFLKAAESVSGTLDSSQCKALYCVCINNAAATALQLKLYSQVVELSSKSLTHQPANSKALYRRACAYKEMGEAAQRKEEQFDAFAVQDLYLKAKDDFTKLFEVTDNKEARQKWNELTKNIARLKVLVKEKGLVRPAEPQLSKEEEPRPKPRVEKNKPNPTEKKLLEKNVALANQIVRAKVEKDLLEGELPAFRFELERNFKTLEKKPDLLLRYVLKFNEDYILKTQPDIDLVFSAINILLDGRVEGEDNHRRLDILAGFSKTKNFASYKKMLTKGEKQSLQNKVSALYPLSELATSYFQ